MSAFVALGACGGGSSEPTSITATWKMSTSVPGSSLVLTLNQQGQVVSGTGTYSVEAGPNGNLTVTGSYNPPDVTLNLMFDSGKQATLDVSLVDASHLHGTLTYTGAGGGTTTVDFVRQ